MLAVRALRTFQHGLEVEVRVIVDILIFAGILSLALGIKWVVGWAILVGFVALLLVCAIPILDFLFRPLR